MKNTLIIALLLSCTSMTQAAEAKNHSPAYKSKNISANLVLLQGKGGNITLSKGKDGLLIIDDDYVEMSDALKKEIEKQGGINKLKFILNTHWHGDHTGNNANLGKNTNIVAHNNVRKRLSSRQEVPLFKKVLKPYPEHALPNLTYPKSMVIHFNNDTLTLEHYPNGHTDADSVIFFEKANVVHMGDHMFYPMFPFVDIHNGGNAVSYSNNVEQIIQKINDATIVIPGHGAVTDKQGLIRFHKMLTGTIAEVRALKSSGLSLEKTQSVGLSQQWKSWGNDVIKEPTWISFIYQSL